MALQSDGKIVVAADFSVVRYNSDGTLDTTFDTDGIATTNIGAGQAAHAVAVQSNGKIIVAGSGFSGDFSVVRYNSDGTLDTTFDTDGIATTTVGRILQLQRRGQRGGGAEQRQDHRRRHVRR